MAKGDIDIHARLHALREAYAAQLPAKLDEIEVCWRAFRGDLGDRERLQQLHRLVHTLAGSGGTFGFKALGDRARAAEQLLKDWLPEDTARNEEQLEQLEAMFRELPRAISHLPRPVPERTPAETGARSPAKDPEHRLVYLVEDDQDVATELALQLGHFGYETVVFSTAAAAAAAIDDRVPAALIVDLTLPEGPLAGAELMRGIQARQAPRVPVVVISARNDFEARLEAVRAGGEAYFVKPVDVTPLVDQLDKLTQRMEAEPYRILVIDDDAVLAAHHALVLEQAGMEVTTVTDPREVMDAMANANPELVLMDVYMPECSGRDLARLIRQQDTFLSIPIVYLSSETRLEHQFTAMSMGGDDFLTKPIENEHLVSSIRIRVERARALNALMVQDSLTGLLKHTKIKERLAAEISRARRTRSPVSFAMIDIDHFKAVNDRYGHMSGDRVIKGLARLLQQRLRQSDSIGRYGGEEFAVVLTDCDTAAAAQLIDEIRERFAALRYLHDDEEFAVTFSAGLASFPAYEDLESVNRAADEALYEAKRQGRNRVVTVAGCDSPSQTNGRSAC